MAGDDLSHCYLPFTPFNLLKRVWNPGILQESPMNFAKINSISQEKYRNRKIFPALQTGLSRGFAVSIDAKSK
jgi:hypothetical protein